VRDQVIGTTILASVTATGTAAANGWSFEPSLSADGHYVAFTSGATNLITRDNNGVQDVFRRDLQTRSTVCVSTNNMYMYFNGLGSAASYSPTISADGRYVLFRSKATNLANGSFNGTENLFLRDVQVGTNFAITYGSIGVSAAAMTPDGHFVAFGLGANGFAVWNSQTITYVYTITTSARISYIAISPDGNRIAYSYASGFYVADRAAKTNTYIGKALSASHVGLQFSGNSQFMVFSTTNALAANDTNKVADVYLYDVQAKTNLLISQSCKQPGAANGPSDSPTISADGRFIAYRSFASDIVPGDTNGLPDIFLYDRQTGATVLVSASAFGDFAANSFSLAPAFSGDSQTLVFQSWASDLTAQDFNQSADLFSLKLYSSNATPAFVDQVILVPPTPSHGRISGKNPLLSWTAVVGKNYLVQFKNDLSDPFWQPLSSGVVTTGGNASATDFAPSPGQRFYRIMAY
jgi:Tol biopolymer transport system component